MASLVKDQYLRSARESLNKREPHKRHDDEYDKLLSLIRTRGKASRADMTEETASRSGREDRERVSKTTLGFENHRISVER